MQQAYQVASLVAAYCLCSSLMLIVNKMAVLRFPYPSALLLLQALSSTSFIVGLGKSGLITIQKLQIEQLPRFSVLVAGFVAALYTNVNALKYVSVDAVICARAAMPIILAPLEFYFFKRALPSLRSWAALFGVFIGCSFYARDLSCAYIGKLWLGAWVAVSISQIMWLKHTVEQSVNMSSWERSLYKNGLSLPVFVFMTFMTGEMSVAALLRKNAVDWTFVGLSCLLGVGVSYSGFALAAAVSATLFATIGNVCKVLTILISFIIGADHSGAAGTCGLLFAIAAGTCYTEPPARDSTTLEPISHKDVASQDK